VRVLAATHRDLDRDRRAGRFRHDLFYRLHQAVIIVPPLRERPEDIEVLARSLLIEQARALGLSPPRPSLAFLEALRAQPWHGNARELRSALHAVLLWSDGREALEPRDLVEALNSLTPALDDEERAQQQSLLSAWREAGGNQEAARRALGLTRAAWRHRWRRLGLRGLQEDSS
jgi:DNA-binding NtrC family response regulator